MFHLVDCDSQFVNSWKWNCSKITKGNYLIVRFCALFFCFCAHARTSLSIASSIHTLILLLGYKIKANYTLHHYTCMAQTNRQASKSKSNGSVALLHRSLIMHEYRLVLIAFLRSFRHNSNEFYGKPKHAKRTLRLNWALSCTLVSISTTRPSPSLFPCPITRAFTSCANSDVTFWYFYATYTNTDGENARHIGCCFFSS